MRLNTDYVNLITAIVKKNIKKSEYILHEPELNKADSIELKKCIKSKYVSTVSNYVNLFESKISKFVKSKYVIATINGTAAIEIALRSIGVKKNEEVLIPNLNYIASANCVLRIGAIPHFLDSNLKNLGIDTIKLKKYLKSNTYFKNGKLINKKTKRIVKAIIPTHIFGNSCDIKEIIKIARKYKLKVIEDSSEALGSFYENKHLGTLGDAGVISFNGNKIITTGSGGVIITNNKKIYLKSIHLSKIARKKKYYWEYDYDQLGYNYRMPGINASLGISQLKKINKLLIKKKKLNYYYNKSFDKNENINVIRETKNSKWNFWLNNIIIKNINLKKRNKIIISLNKKKIFVRPIWKLMHKINYLKKYPRMNLKNSLIAEKSVISLPSSSNLIK